MKTYYSKSLKCTKFKNSKISCICINTLCLSSSCNKCGNHIDKVLKKNTLLKC